MTDVGNHSSAGTIDITRLGKISGNNALSLVQTLVVAGVMDKKDVTLIGAYLLIN